MFTIIIGYIAALVTTLCLVPQLYKIVLDKNVEGVSIWTYWFLLSGQMVWILYGVLVNDNVIICANLISGLISFLIIVFFNIYKKRTQNTLPSIVTLN